MKILIADSDLDAAELITQVLTDAGHSVTVVKSGTQALQLAGDEAFDAIVLERQLPGTNGLSIVRLLRSNGDKTPVLFLTTMASVDDRVDGLESGADDYMSKPFAASELKARLKAITRRPLYDLTATKLAVGDILLDLRLRQVTRAGRRIDMQPRELLMLEVLMRDPHDVMTRAVLLQKVWDMDFDPGTNLVETHISRLRSKLNEGFSENAIRTVRGVGYTMRRQGLQK